jgi:hypothetical protein
VPHRLAVNPGRDDVGTAFGWLRAATLRRRTIVTLAACAHARLVVSGALQLASS